MRFVDRILWLCLSLALTSCSLVTEFPESLDGGSPTGAQRDGGRGVTCDDDDDECRGDASTACGNGCDSPQALVCGRRGCECEPGDGPCRGGQVCDTEGPAPKCVGCRGNADCASTNGRNVCVDSECRECNPATNDGCSDNTPICNAQGMCVGCKADPNDCPAGQRCVAGIGCFGCDISAGIGKNGCSGGTPVCLQVNGGFQCSPCRSNADCQGGFCNENAGAGNCVMACDPPPLMPGQSSNGCATPAAPICKASVDGAFSCQPCTAADACPVQGQVCSTTGATAGRCVPMMSACAAPTPVPGPDGACVQCVTDAQCVGNAAGPICTRNTCGPCAAGRAGDDACMRANPATPLCNGTTCIARCRDSAECAATPRTPICGADGRCTACTEVRSSDRACADANDATPACVRSGANAGACAVCTLNESCNIRPRESGVCLAAPAGGPLACNECNPEAVFPLPFVCGIGERCDFVAANGRYTCVPAAPAPVLPPAIGAGGLISIDRDVR